MSGNPQVSCIVPAYNAEKYLQQALESVLAQSGVGLEIILVNDGSTDRTVEIAGAFGDAVRVISQPNSGPAVARNRGLVEARGEFIAFLDADDQWHREKLERQLAAFGENPKLQLCAAHVQNFRGEMEFVGNPVPGFGAEMLIRRTVYDLVGPFTTGPQHADFLEWMIRARENNVVEVLLPETLSYRRLHDKNISTLQASQSLKDHLLVLHASLKRRGLKGSVEN